MMAKLLHATESFVVFDAQELGQSIPRRFETQLVKKTSTLGSQTRKHARSYEQLNGSANVIVLLDPSLPSSRLSYILQNTPTTADRSES